MYHLVQIALGYEWKTAFHMHYGSYEWLVMPFGLTNVPAAIQHFVNAIFADMLDVCIIVYLDNILIYSKDMESHQQHIWEVLCQLWLHGLFAKPEKCKLHLDSVEYLGYHLSPKGLTMSPYSTTGSSSTTLTLGSLLPSSPRKMLLGFSLRTVEALCV